MGLWDPICSTGVPRVLHAGPCGPLASPIKPPGAGVFSASLVPLLLGTWVNLFGDHLTKDSPTLWEPPFRTEPPEWQRLPWERSRGTAVAVREPELLLRSGGPCTEPKVTEEENKGNSPPGAQALQRGMPSFQFCVAWGKDLLLGLGYLLLMMGPVAIELVEVMHEGIYGKGWAQGLANRKLPIVCQKYPMRSSLGTKHIRCLVERISWKASRSKTCIFHCNVKKHGYLGPSLKSAQDSVLASASVWNVWTPKLKERVLWLLTRTCGTWAESSWMWTPTLYCVSEGAVSRLWNAATCLDGSDRNLTLLSGVALGTCIHLVIVFVKKLQMNFPLANYVAHWFERETDLWQVGGGWWWW